MVINITFTVRVVYLRGALNVTPPLVYIAAVVVGSNYKIKHNRLHRLLPIKRDNNNSYH